MSLSDRGAMNGDRNLPKMKTTASVSRISSDEMSAQGSKLGNELGYGYFYTRGRAALRNYPPGHAGRHLQQDRQHQPPHHPARLQRLLQGRIPPVETRLVQLQPGRRPPRLRRGHQPRLHRTYVEHRHRQQRLLPGVHVPDLLGLLRRVQQPVLQLGGRRHAGLRPVGVHLQSAHVGGEPVPAGRHGAPVRVVVQVGLPLDHLGRRGQRRVVLVGRAHEPRLLAGGAEPRGLAALGDPAGHPLAAGRLQPRLLHPDALRLQLHRHQPRRVAPPVHRPAPADAGRLQDGHPRLLGHVRRQRHDLRRGARHRELVPVLQEILRPGDVRLSQLPGGGEAGARRGQPPEEGTPQLPHPGLRQGVRQDVAPQGAPALAHRRAAVRLQLAVLRQALHPQRRAAAAPAHPHRREALRLPGVQQALHAQRPPEQAHQDAHGRRRRRRQEGQRQRHRHQQPGDAALRVAGTHFGGGQPRQGHGQGAVPSPRVVKKGPSPARDWQATRVGGRRAVAPSRPRVWKVSVTCVTVRLSY